MNTTVYRSAPICVVDGIPVFSATDGYTQNYERIASDHVTAAVEQGVHNPFIDDATWADMEQSTQRLLHKYLQPGVRVLDVGVGLGRLLSEHPKCERFGIDISLDYLRSAAAKGIEVSYAKVEDMPYHSGIFDVVVCTDVLEHVPDLNQAIAPIFRVLKPGGHLIVRSPVDEDLSPYLAEDYPYHYVHLRTFNLESLRLLLCRIFPFEYVEHGYTFIPSPKKSWLPRLPAAALSRLLAWLGTRVGPMRRAAVRMFFRRPTEITVVVRRGETDDVSQSLLQPAELATG